jgi:ABC-type polysaccharide/polyol phosphate transport system ATPase subunit
MPSNDIAISVRNLTKTYRLFGHPGDRVKQFLSFGLKQYHREFTALEDVSFEIKKGETVGIIGRNGSGKSTLLQLVCGILKPTAGTVQVNGRVAALLELGAGFNPEFTGRENVYFQGALMGFTKAQMDEKFADIAAFADIGEFIDQPVRTYSSGMFVRLAFAVAIHVEPDILVVDEALAVGDSRFQAQCFRQIERIRDLKGTILFVTHSADQVSRYCDRTLLFDEGRLACSGHPKEIVSRYFSSMFASSCRPEQTPTTYGFAAHAAYSHAECRFGNGAAEIVNFDFLDVAGQRILPPFKVGQTIRLCYAVIFHRPVARVTFAVAIGAIDGINLFGVNSRDLGESRQASGPFAAGQVVHPMFELTLNLANGDYLISLSVSEETGEHLEPLDRRYDAILFSIAGGVKQQRGQTHLAPAFTLTSAT